MSGSNTMASRIIKSFSNSNANFEEFDVSSADNKLRIKAQTLRLYTPNRTSGVFSLPPIRALHTCEGKLISR
jgi:hypothetical protein